MEKKCIACGMPMKTADDHAMGDESKDYCKYCAREDGEMQDWEEKLQSMTDFIIHTQGINQDAAFSAAEEALKHLPAWKELFEG